MKKEEDFLKSPAEAPIHRKVLLEDKDTVPKTQRLLNNCVQGREGVERVGNTQSSG